MSSLQSEQVGPQQHPAESHESASKAPTKANERPFPNSHAGTPDAYPLGFQILSLAELNQMQEEENSFFGGQSAPDSR